MSKTKNTAAISRSKSIRGVERAQHFASGGSLPAWRGVHQVQRDRKREASRRACRLGGKEE